jgi:3-dehydroquinate synthase
VHEVRIQSLERQKHRLAGSTAFADDGASHAVSRSEITAGFVPWHERFTRRVDEPCAFTTQCLGEQKPRLSLDHQRGGMKLHKLEIDHLRASRERHRDSVSGRHVRVRGLVIHLTGAAGCQEHVRCERNRQSAISEQKARADAAAVADRKADDPRVILGRHSSQLRGAIPQDPANLTAGRVVRVQHSAGTVCRFHGERRLSIRTAIESGAPRHQLSHESRTILDENLYRARIAEPIAGGHRVRGMQLRRVAGADSGRNASLRVTGIAFFGSGFGQDEHVAVSGDFRRRAQRGDATADDEKVRAKLQAAADAVILPSQKTMRSRPPQTEAIRLAVRTSTGSYTIEIAAGSSGRLRAILDAARVPARRFVVSSQTVWGFHGDELRRVTDEEPILLPDGERYKQLATVGRIYDALIRAAADRSSAIIAIGGGVTGDIAGFAAATYLRGIPVVQVPTTLLAQVDSAVGGKVGVNHPMGKNLIGAFHPPAAVVVDPSLLSTLPRREFRAGLYEVVKYGVIASRSLFERTAADLTALFGREPGALLPVVSESCRIKATIVEQDERESGIRRTLNFGHTAGHALEAVTKYRRFLHGEAVAYGMLAAAQLAAARGAFTKADRDALSAHIMQMGPLPPVSDLSAADIIEATRRDKKVIEGRLHFVLPTKIGAATTVTDVSTQELAQALLAIGLKA